MRAAGFHSADNNTAPALTDVGVSRMYCVCLTFAAQRNILAPVSDILASMGKTATAFRLSAVALQLLTTLSRKLGLSKAGVVELALRRLADLEGVPVPETEPADDATDE